jgi:glutamyl-tRNA reductase
MAPHPDTRMAPADFVVVGASHKTCSTALRDRLFVATADEPAILSALQNGGFDQVISVSTCDRVEFQGYARDVDAAVQTACALLGMRTGGETLEPASVYALSGRDAVRHVFAVVSSLESAIVGETEVLGQLKEIHERARQGDALGSELDSLFQNAFSAAKDVRTNTAIAEGPLSLANAALHSIRSLFGDLDDVAALLLGPGEMGGLMLDHFRQHGLRHVVVAGPTVERAASAARAHDAHATTYDALPAALERADLVIGAGGTGQELVSVAMMRQAIRVRRRKPVFILDVAVPADAAREIATLEDVFLYDLDDLEGIARSSQSARDVAAQEAWLIVDQHADSFMEKSAEREAGSEVAGMRAYFEQTRRDVLDAHGSVDAGEATRLLINRLLHRPSEVLRAAAREPGDPGSVADAARRLFALDENNPSGDDETPPDSGQGSWKNES